MADTNINDNRDAGGSATTVLVTVVIVAIIGLAFYFGYARSHWGNVEPTNTDNAGINVNVGGTFPTGSGEEGGAAE